MVQSSKQYLPAPQIGWHLTVQQPRAHGSSVRYSCLERTSRKRVVRVGAGGNMELTHPEWNPQSMLDASWGLLAEAGQLEPFVGQFRNAIPNSGCTGPFFSFLDEQLRAISAYVEETTNALRGVSQRLAKDANTEITARQVNAQFNPPFLAG